MKIKVILVDDHAKIHLSLSQLLLSFEDIELVAQGRSGEEAIELCEQYQTDVLIMDVIMSSMSGIEATSIIHKKFPHIKIIALSGFQDKASIEAMLEAGAIGYILKTSDSTDIVSTIRSAYQGNSVLSPDVLQTLLTPQKKKNPRKEYGLTRKEIIVLRHLVEGATNAEIADTMFISISTVKFHVSNILQKLDVATRTEAVSLVLSEKLV